ncbi:MAG: hypothetical protein SW833_05640 [Cyanobacteriota bacterium]|nr:hypothetical protein [Cyanobacteriota bacterium]
MNCPTTNHQLHETEQLRQLSKKRLASLSLILLLSGGFSVEVETSKLYWRVSLAKEPNPLVKILDGLTQ